MAKYFLKDAAWLSIHPMRTIQTRFRDMNVSERKYLFFSSGTPTFSEPLTKFPYSLYVVLVANVII